MMFAASCTQEQKKDESLEGFPENITKNAIALKGVKMEASEHILRSTSMSVRGDYLLISSPDQQFHFKLVDWKNDKFVTSFGPMGDGPCEFAFPAFLLRIPGQPGKTGVFNKKKWTYCEFGFEDLIRNQEPQYTRQLRKFDVNYQRLVLFEQDVFVGFGIFNKRYAQADSSGKVTRKFGEYPFQETYENTDYGSLAMAYQGEINVRPSGGYVLCANAFSPNFDILASGDGELKVSKSFRTWPAGFVARNEPATIGVMLKGKRNGFISSSVTDRHIYLLYAEEGKPKKKGPLQGNKVMVFDWQGELVTCFALDRHVDSIAVSEDDTKLFTYRDIGDAELAMFSLAF